MKALRKIIGLAVMVATSPFKAIQLAAVGLLIAQVAGHILILVAIVRQAFGPFFRKMWTIGVAAAFQATWKEGLAMLIIGCVLYLIVAAVYNAVVGLVYTAMQLPSSVFDWGCRQVFGRALEMRLPEDREAEY